MSKYFKLLRLDWIMKRQKPFNRKDLADAFNISIKQAINDIQEYIRENPNVWVYNKSLKIYERKTQ